MYFPKSQIETNLYSNGDLIILNTKVPYTGFYWSTSTGKFFIGKTPEDPLSSTELTRFAADAASNIAKLEPNLGKKISHYNYTLQNLKYLNLKGITDIKAPSTPRYFFLKPSLEDYKNKKVNRYFCKKINEPIFIEVSVEEYLKLKNKDKSIAFDLYKPFILNWIISGDKDKVALENKNEVSYKELKRNYTGLSVYLKNNYLQFYSLYTPGGEFLLPNGKDYIGLYHIHPDKGPMVGIKHTLLPHSLLTPIDKTPSLESPSPIIPPSPNIYNGSSNTSGGY